MFGCMFLTVGVPAVYPVGSGSFICMLVAGSGPLLVAVMVKVPVPPTFTGVVPVLVMVSPALFTCIVLSGMVTVVGYSVHVAVAWLVVVVPAIVAVIGAVNVSVACDPFARLVIVHMPVVWLYVPAVGVPAVYPVGSGSFICMLVAGSGPLLVAVMVKVPVPPTFTGVVPVLVMVKLAFLV